MAEHDATRADAEFGARDEVEPTPVPVEGAVSAGTGITGSGYGATGGMHSSDDPANLGVPLDDDGSYPSAMSGTTNANAHTEGVPQGRTDSTRDER
jgi:hypothetical protein